MLHASVAERISRQCLPDGVRLRAETAADFDWLAALYAQSRKEELAPIAWSTKEKRAFLDDQFRRQHAHYREHYVGAEFLLIQRDDVPIGRLYVHRGEREIRLMDIVLVAAERGHGLGSVLIRALMDEAARSASSLTLHVEAFNPASRLYARFGFRLIEDRGIYQFLGWSAPVARDGEPG